MDPFSAMLGLGRFGGGSFDARYRVYPMAFLDKPSAEEGDKVILPPSALDRLASLHVEYPMLFKVENPETGRSTHCGVLEFVAEEGNVYLPQWMMNNLLLQVGDVASFGNVSLPKGTYCKLQPVTSDFLDITNPKAVLEKSLRSYTCLTTGDCFVLNYNNKKYEIEVKETKPGPAISVVETDCQVDFEAPKDYKPPPRPEPQEMTKEMVEEEADEEETDNSDTFLAFSGSAVRLDGKPVDSSGRPVPVKLNNSRWQPSEAESSDPKASTSSSSAAKGSKPGKVVFGSGNRLLDKLNKEKQQGAPSSGGAPGPNPAPPAEADSHRKDDPNTNHKEDNNAEKSKEDSKFSAFSGKAYSLK